MYGKPPPDVTGKNVLMLDFSYKRPILEQMIERAGPKFLVLDHHVSAQQDLEGLDGIRKGVEILFDINRSGAMMAWNWWRPHDDAPNLVRYVQDRDLWKFELPSSREIAATIFSYDYTFPNWDALAHALSDRGLFTRVVQEGYAILRKQDKDIRELLEVTTRQMIIGGHAVPVANLPYTLASDAAHELCKQERWGGLPVFAACYFDRGDGQRVFSLRSNNDFDVSQVAASYGGGGHKKAAGFQRPIGWEGDR